MSVFLEPEAKVQAKVQPCVADVGLLFGTELPSEPGGFSLKGVLLILCKCAPSFPRGHGDPSQAASRKEEASSLSSYSSNTWFAAHLQPSLDTKACRRAFRAHSWRLCRGRSPRLIRREDGTSGSMRLRQVTSKFVMG